LTTSFDGRHSNFIAGVVIATFASPREACAALGVLGGRQDKNRLFVIFFDKTFPTKAYESKTIKTELRRFNPQKIEEHLAYQEIDIIVTLPKKLTFDMLPLAFDAETTKTIQEIRALCGAPLIKERGDKAFWTFRYAGKPLYFAGRLCLDRQHELRNPIVRVRVKQDYSCL
jgi:hypothetical protein